MSYTQLAVTQIISLVSSLLPIIFFISFCTKTHIKGFWVIFLYSIASLLSDFFISSNWGSLHQYLLWNLYTIVEYSILSFFFYLIIKIRLIRTLIIITSAIYFIVFFMLIKGITLQFNSVLSSFSQVIILGLCLIYLFSSMKHSVETINLINPMFLIVVALLLYVAFTLFLFVIANNLSAKEMAEYWGNITIYNNILTNLLFSTAFLLYRFQYKSSTPENQTVDFTSPNDR